MIKQVCDIKLKVGVLLIGVEHQVYYEGPCRFGGGESLQPGFDRFANAQRHEAMVSHIREILPAYCELLEPVHFTRTDAWENREAQWTDMAATVNEADVLFVAPSIGCDDIVIEFAGRFGKPMIIDPGLAFSGSSLVAAIRCRYPDYSIHSFVTWADAVNQLKVFHAVKVIRNTNILLASRFGSNISFSSVDSFRSHDEITRNLGVKFRYVNVHELLDCMSPASETGNHTTPGRETFNITEADMEEVRQLTDELTAGAADVTVQREYLENSLKAYVTVKKYMDRLDCNAFSIPCPDVCSTRRLNEMKFTFCLTHSLLTEQGIPSTCEYDVNAALSEQVLIAISGMRPFMGNTWPIVTDHGKIVPSVYPNPEDIEDLEKDPENLYFMQHSVPHRKMRGGEELAPYALRYFAYDQKFGAVMRYDFSRDAGQKITCCRFSPDGKKLFIGTGTIVKGGGFENINCNNAVYFRVNNQSDFFEKQCNVGNHLTMVFGDYSKELIKLTKELGIEAIVAE